MEERGKLYYVNENRLNQNINLTVGRAEIIEIDEMSLNACSAGSAPLRGSRDQFLRMELNVYNHNG